MLSLHWLHGSYKGQTNVGFNELIVELAAAPHHSLFSTELVITLVQFFWDYYYYRIFFACFLPYIAYFMATIFYITVYSVRGVPEEGVEALIEFIVVIFIAVSTIYFMFFEIVAIVRDGWDYTKDIYNLFDWSTYLLTFVVIINTDTRAPVTDPPAEFGSYTQRAISTFLVILMWVKTFYWMRLFDSTSFYVHLIGETISDIIPFFLLFLFILMTFGSAILVMNTGR